ncbi:MAG: DUF3160 domain-containing protein [Deltaproteobacteria bacterium]|nr:DUF3160 domain-containing protein [Deltaproteobacteria bacterium]
MNLLRFALTSTLALALACGHAPAKPSLGPPPSLPELKKGNRPAPQPDHFWEPIEPEVRGGGKAPELPIAEGGISRVEAATRIWDQLGEAGRQRLGADGVVVVGADVLPASPRMGVFYTQLRDQRVPYVITLDALGFAVHVAFERTLAEVDEAVIAPGVRALLAMLEARLGAEQKGAGTEVGEGLRLARGIVAVANALAREGAALVPPDLAPLVAQEVALVESAPRGVETSPLLGTKVDYASLAAPHGAADPRAYRALAWLSSAPLLLAARTEVPGATAPVSTARTHARAAMLLARAIDREIDPAIHDAFTRLSRLVAFLWGPPDDLTPGELGELAAGVDVRVLDPKHIADVTKIDRLRRRAMKGRLPKLVDAGGVAGAGALSVRLLGGHAPPDSVVLSSIAEATRSLPSVLDVAAFLDAKEGRAARSESGVATGPAYDAALSQAIASRPPVDAPSRHASVYESLLDVVMTWLAAEPGARRTVDSVAARRAALDSALALWTFARHDGRPLARGHTAKASEHSAEIAVTGAPLPAFVEAAPDVIARLVAAAAQMRRGLLGLRALPASSPAMTLLAEVEDVLRIALRVATATVNDEATSPEDATALASLPARLVRIEGATPVAVSADVFVDTAKGHRLASLTSVVEPMVVLVPEGGSGKTFLAVGAHIAHHELRAPLEANVTRDVAALERPRYTSAFRMVR